MKQSSAYFRKLGWVGVVVSAAWCAAEETNPPAPMLTIDALVAEVVQNNPELDFYRAEVAAAGAGRKLAAQWENPELSADLGSKRVWERHGSAIGDGAAWSVGVAQAFEFPGRLALRKAIANRQTELARLALTQYQAALATRARSLGYTAIFAQQKADAAREVTERIRSVVEVLVQREPAGVAPLLDRRMLEASVLVLYRRESQAEREVQAAWLELNQLRGAPPAMPVKLTGPLPFFTNAPPLAGLLEIAATNAFDIRMREAELAQQGFAVKLARNERYPKVTLAPFYSSEKANDEQRIFGLGLSAPMPLWHQNGPKVEAAQARVQQAEASLRVTHREVQRKVSDHALALQTKLEEIGRWHPKAHQELREAAELADRHYRLGAVPVTLYVEMQTRYLDALDAVLATRVEALEHRQQLELLVGQSLDTVSSR